MYKKIIIYIAILLMIIATIYFCAYDKTIENVNSIYEKEKLVEGCMNTLSDEILEGTIGILEIEKIGVKASIKEGSTSEILNEYMGHIEGTAIYDGNVGLAAHNRGNSHAYFERLNELELGDKIVYKTQYGNSEYEVINKKVIIETDWSMLKKTDDNRITMITCIKNKPNQRLCIQALKLNRKEDNNEEFN